MADDVEKADEKAPIAKRSLRHRIVVGAAIYLGVAFATSFIGFNLLGAVFLSGPLIGRVTDAQGHGIRGAFVAYEWGGRSLHGATGCKAAAIVRTGFGGFYVVPWQGWRLFYKFGWGISPLGPAIWAPGYVTVSDGRGGYVYAPEAPPPANRVDYNTGGVDKSTCFGWVYREGLIELRATRFARTFAKTCAIDSQIAVRDLTQLSSEMLDVLGAKEGALLGTTPTIYAMSERYRGFVEKVGWTGSSYDPTTLVTSQERSEFCQEVRADYLASGGQLNEN